MNYKNFQSWAISYEVFSWIKNNLPKNSTILELGSGTGTTELCNLYKVYSVEHDPKWINLTKSTYIYAPLEVQNGYKWYNRDILKNNLPKNYDLLLIDGPPGSIGRKPFLENLDLFNLDVPIIIDDTNRESEQQLFEELNNFLMRDYTTILSSKKQSKIIL